jgi:hypothetical protein
MLKMFLQLVTLLDVMFTRGFPSLLGVCGSDVLFSVTFSALLRSSLLCLRLCGPDCVGSLLARWHP